MLLGITKRQTKDFDSELNANCWHPQVGFLITITIIIIIIIAAIDGLKVFASGASVTKLLPTAYTHAPTRNSLHPLSGTTHGK